MEGLFQHPARMCMNLRGRSPSLPIEARDLTVGLVEAHEAVDVRDDSEGMADHRVSQGLLEPLHPYADDSAQQRLGALNGVQWQSHRWPGVCERRR